jgi:hypothetical protein
MIFLLILSYEQALSVKPRLPFLLFICRHELVLSLDIKRAFESEE